MIRALAAVMLGLSSVGFFQAQAEGLFISTTYPSQVVRAGDTVSISFNVEVVELAPQVVELEIRDAPEGWRAVFQGGGRVVHSVYVKPEEVSTVSLSVEVPETVEDGSYGMTVIARGEDDTSQMPIELIIGESAPPQIQLDPELPILQGTPTTNFSYRVTLKNEADEDLLVSLEADLPEGFDVTFKRAFGGQEVSSLPVTAGQTETLDVQVQPGELTAAGEYLIRVRAQAAEASDEVELTAVVAGQPQLSLSAPDGRLSGEATAGQETPLELVLRNDGTAPAENIALEASPPASWNVRFEPAEIASLGPGEEVQVQAFVNPPGQAVAGDYVVTMRARQEGSGTESVEFRITVTTSTVWGVVGLVLIAAALGVVALAVGRYGRR
jgi:uncharacterized membrane protein